MTRLEWTVLCYANEEAGTAAYLFENELRTLARRGLIVADGPHRFIATDAGRAAWLRGPGNPVLGPLRNLVLVPTLV